MTAIVWKASRRYLWQHPWQLVLAVLGVALGVAVVVAVDLATESSRRALDLSMKAVSGHATHQIVGGPTGLSESLYVRLRLETGLRESAPVVEVYGAAGDEFLRLLGIDPLAEAPFRAYQQDGANPPLRELLTIPNSVLMAPDTAARLGLQPGDTFTLALAGRPHRMTLAGLLSARDAPPAALDGLLIADIATAQEVSGSTGRLSWIDVILREGSTEDPMAAHVAALLPPDAALIPAASRTRAMGQMTQAFHTNLTAMSLLALVVGMFLIYNTITFLVLQRRQLNGLLRLLGVTRSEMLWVIAGEALVLGVAGTVLGLVFGIGLGQGLVRLVARTINDLYFVITVSDLQIVPLTLVKGCLLGLGATALAAVVPGIEAAWAAPQAALRRSGLETGVRRLMPWFALCGLVMMLAALIVLLVSGKNLIAAFTALFLLILGLTATVPALVALLVRATVFLVSGVAPVEVRLALRGISASLSRSGLAIAALTLALSATVGVGVMIESFRAAVDVWLASTLRADIYVATPSLMSSRTQAELDPGIIALVREVPGIAGMSSGRSVIVESEQGLVEVFAIDPARGHALGYRLKGNDTQKIWDAFRNNQAVLVSEPYAYHRDVKTGQDIALRTDAGMRTFTVAGIYYDYDSGPGTVLMNRALYERYWHDRAVDALGLYLGPGASLDQVMDALRKAIPGDAGVLIRANREIRQASLDIFDRTFTITHVLRLLAILVAFVGILSVLMALQLERARELAILRATGFTPAQTGSLVTLQAGFMGFIAGLLALPFGLILAELLIHVINQRAFGWSMQTLIRAEVLVQSAALAIVAALLAAIYPAWKMARSIPAAALRVE